MLINAKLIPKIAACVFTALVVISTDKVFSINILQGWYLPHSCISYLIVLNSSD